MIFSREKARRAAQGEQKLQRRSPDYAELPVRALRTCLQKPRPAQVRLDGIGPDGG